jgi:hypothetical protein
LVDCLYSLGLEFATHSVGHMCRKYSWKINLIVLKFSFDHFLHLWIWNKFLMHNDVQMWKIITSTKIILIWIIQFFSNRC